MSEYGSKITHDGKKIGTDSDFIPASVGIVENVTIQKIEIESESEYKKLVFHFRQENGAVVKYSEFEPNDKFQNEAILIDELNKRIKHIATKFIDEEEYHTAVAGSTDFLGFISKVKALLDTKINSEAKFRMIFRYDKNLKYTILPRYPNFIESMSISKETSKLVISDFDKNFMRKVKPDAEPAAKSNGEGQGEQLESEF